MIEDADASAGDRFGHGIVVVFILEVDVGDGSAWKNEACIGHAMAGDGEFIVSFGRGWSGGGRGQGRESKSGAPLCIRASIMGDSPRTPAGRRPSWGPSGRPDFGAPGQDLHADGIFNFDNFAS